MKISSIQKQFCLQFIILYVFLILFTEKLLVGITKIIFSLNGILLRYIFNPF